MFDRSYQDMGRYVAVSMHGRVWSPVSFHIEKPGAK